MSDDHLNEEHAAEACRAYSLAERLECRRAVAALPELSDTEREQGRKRLARWHQELVFRDDDAFAARLAEDGLEESELSELLAFDDARLARLFPHPPPWWEHLTSAYDGEDGESVPWPDDLSEAARGFLSFLDPLVRRARQRLANEVRELVRRHAGAPFDPPHAERLLFAGLPGLVLPAINRSLVLELRIAGLQEELDGSTAQERFQSFVTRLSRPAVALEIFRQYPLLGRTVVHLVDQWLEEALEFLERLSADWPELCATFSPRRVPGRLRALGGQAGDLHRGGRSVRILRFASGLRLVYKPKPLAADRHFQELALWLNERGLEPALRILRMIDRGRYGWVEFGRANACRSRAGVRRFYRRQGSFLALLYALEANDLHFQNLIASGEHPLPVDLETLFQPGDRHTGERPDYEAYDALNDSVLKVGLLPNRIWRGAGQEAGIDLSGMSSVEGQHWPLPEATVVDAGTDEMRYELRHQAMADAANLPVLRGEKMGVADHVDDVLEGFTAAYRLLVEHRDDLLAAGGPVAAFAGDEIRLLLRATRFYALLLDESRHPQRLGDGLSRERLFDRLYLQTSTREDLRRAIPSERRDLWRGDVPCFVLRPESRDVEDGDGRRLEAFLDESGLELVRRRILRLGEADLERQRWFIRASLATAGESGPTWANIRGGERRRIAMVPGEPRRDAFLATAGSIGRRLDVLGVHAEQGLTWLGLQALPQGGLFVEPLGADLYQGIAGITLFLAQLGKTSREERFTELARDAWRATLRQVEETAVDVTRIGAFLGWGSLVYVAVRLAVLWDEATWLDLAQSWRDEIAARLEGDEDLDLLSGAAGAAIVLLRLQAAYPSARTLEVAKLCGERLLERAREQSRGLGWLGPLARERPIPGLAHGASGFAWALGELAALTGDGRFREAAHGALEFERGTFHPDGERWPEMSAFGRENPYADDGDRDVFHAWCHGAAGMALGRVGLLRHEGDTDRRETLRAELRQAARLLRAAGFGHNHSLCHGDFGNVEALVETAAALGDDALRAEALDIAAALVEEGGEGWVCGVPMGVETPCLMTGLAGIGYELLRLARPEEVPSLLRLEIDPLPRTA